MSKCETVFPSAKTTSIANIRLDKTDIIDNGNDSMVYRREEFVYKIYNRYVDLETL